MRSPSLFLASALALTFMVPAQTPGSGSATETPPSAANPAEAGKPEGAAPEPKAEPKAEPKPTLKQMFAKFHPTEGTAKIGTMAEAKLPEGWLFLAGEDGRRFLRELGNRPGPATLGVAIPPDFEDSDVFAVYSYSDEGHVDDSETPDYSQLLVDMKEAAQAQSEERKKAGLGTVELLGWAEPPHYDKAQHKLFWAEKLKFGDGEGLTLNYNVRVLGRAGHLVVQGVGGMEQLAEVAARNQELLRVTEFVSGQRYEEFNADYDKVATYGIGGLIAGGIAAKAGLFAKLALLLKVALKPILVGLCVIGAGIAKIFTGRKKEPQAPSA
jgi:uncharacterized membrane-anchored protein